MRNDKKDKRIDVQLAQFWIKYTFKTYFQQIRML